jgi:ADP-ribose pyrophosphatase YjhB (NUDIX family)
MATFKAHEFIALQDIPDHHFTSSKYEGIMLLSAGQEYRAKWQATTEISFSGEVWEVCTNKGNERFPFSLLRPRPGKIPLEELQARVQLNSALPGKAIIPYLRTKRAPVLSEKPRRRGSKCFFLDESGYYLLQDNGKPWDFIGGQIEKDETPTQALIREVKEEVGLDIPDRNFLYVGTSEAEADTAFWVTHVYMAKAPSSLLRHRSVRKWDSMEQIISNTQNRRQDYQPWVARLARYGSELGDLIAHRTLLAAEGHVSVFRGMRVTTERARSLLDKLGYYTLLKEIYIQQKQKFVARRNDSFPDFVNYFMSPPMTQSLWDVVIEMFQRDYGDKVSLHAMKGDGVVKTNTTTAIIVREEDYEKKEEPLLEKNEHGQLVLKQGVHSFPLSKQDADVLLRSIYESHETDCLSAQDLYREFSLRGYPGTRAIKVKFAAKSEAWGLLTPVVNSSTGRSFIYLGGKRT